MTTLTGSFSGWTAAALLAALSGCASSRPQPTVPPATGDATRDMVLDTDTLRSPSLRVEVACSRTRLRTGVAIISGEPLAAVGAPDLRLDVAVDKEGFARGAYTTLLPLSGGRTFRKSAPAAELYARALDLRVATGEDARLTPKADGAVVVEQLEPGLNYFWRVARRTDRGWVAGEVVRVEAPTCVADMQERGS